MREIERKIVCAMIFSKDGRLFQGMKDPKEGGVYGDCWHIPGGGVGEGETEEQALAREIKEELGLDISGYKAQLVDDTGTGESEKVLKDTGEKVLCKMNFSVYRVDIDKMASEIEISLNDDLEKFVWRKIKDLKNCKLTPPSQILFKKLGYI